MMSEQVKSALTEAVVKTKAQIKRLAKDHTNSFSKYSYTSVDDFKDSLRPIMAENGLRLSMDERSCKSLTTTDDKGKEKTTLKFKFACTLHHISGETAPAEKITVMLPFVGAQTTGQARSYALKEYLKSEFLASSGDSEDADSGAEIEQLSKGEARSIYKDLQDQLRVAIHEGQDAMKKWANDKRPSISSMPKDWQILLRTMYQEGLAGVLPVEEEDEPPAEIVAANESLDRQFKDTVG